MRLFTAINFDKQTKRNIQAVQNRLRELGSGSFTHVENFHLTLVFIGEVDKPRLSDLAVAISKVTVPKMVLEFDRTGNFRRNDGDIWWIGLKENGELRRLQSELYDEISKAGFSLQSNSFKPHLTLARRVRLHRRLDNNELLDSSFSADISSISLMLSERINGRLVYTELERFPS